MARKKTITTVEEEVVPEVSAAELHDQKVAEALSGKEDILQIKPDDLIDDKVEEEPKKKEEVVAPVVDTEKLKEEVTKEVKDQIVSQLQGTKEEKKDAYAEFEKEIWDKEGRVPTYQEALNFVKTTAKEEIKNELNAEIEEENKQKAEELKTQEAEQQKFNDSLNKDWDDQIDDLVKAGKLPRIANANDNRVQIINDASGKEVERIPLEPGKRARYELFKAMYIASEDRITNGKAPITNLKEIYYEHYSNGKQPPGANAPIAGVRKSVSQDNGNSFKYSDIHNKSMEEVLMENR